MLPGFAFLLVCFAGAHGGVSTKSDKCREADDAFRAFINANFGPGETHYGGGVLHQLGPSGNVFSAAAGKLKGYGTDGANMTSTSTMSIASVTKLFVSVLILSKVQDKEANITLETKARDILGPPGPSLPAMSVHNGTTDYTDQITLRQLLTHTSGMAHPYDDKPLHSVADWYTIFHEASPLSIPSGINSRMFNSLRLGGICTCHDF